MKTFFTADTHFGHENIIQYCNRPFKSVGEMDSVLIRNWNHIVHPEDVVYHLRDFAWRNIGKYVGQLNGIIHLIRGSHDKQVTNSCAHFASVKNLTSIVIDGNRIVLCHHAMRVWQASHFNSWQLFGHSHGRVKPVGKQWDVGVDRNDFYPLSYDYVKTIMEKQPYNFNYIKVYKEYRGD